MSIRGEIETGGTIVIDRHQRTVIELDDEPAAAQDIQAIATQRRDQQTHRDERAEDRGADRSRETRPSGSSAFLDNWRNGEARRIGKQSSRYMALTQIH